MFYSITHYKNRQKCTMVIGLRVHNAHWEQNLEVNWLVSSDFEFISGKNSFNSAIEKLQCSDQRKLLNHENEQFDCFWPKEKHTLLAKKWPLRVVLKIYVCKR